MEAAWAMKLCDENPRDIHEFPVLWGMIATVTSDGARHGENSRGTEMQPAARLIDAVLHGTAGGDPIYIHVYTIYRFSAHEFYYGIPECATAACRLAGAH